MKKNIISEQTDPFAEFESTGPKAIFKSLNRSKLEAERVKAEKLAEAEKVKAEKLAEAERVKKAEKLIEAERVKKASKTRFLLNWILGTITLTILTTCCIILYKYNVVDSGWWFLTFIIAYFACFIGYEIVEGGSEEQKIRTSNPTKPAVIYASILLTCILIVTCIYVVPARQQEQRQAQLNIQIEAYKTGNFRHVKIIDDSTIYYVKLVRRIKYDSLISMYVMPDGSVVNTRSDYSINQACTDYVVSPNIPGHDIRIQYNLVDIDACTRLSHDSVTSFTAYRTGDTIIVGLHNKNDRLFSYDFTDYPQVKRVVSNRIWNDNYFYAGTVEPLNVIDAK
jgi:hypothetical protein